MIQKLEDTYIPASELEHANLLETVHYCIFQHSSASFRFVQKVDEMERNITL